MPLQHLDDEAQHAVKLAERIAHQAGLDYVGTDHVLLAVLRLADSSGARLLHRLGVDELQAAAKIDELVERSGEDTWVFGRLPGSPHYRNVIANAIDEATRLKAPRIGTVHLVLGLLREQDSTAQQALSLLGVTLKSAREAAARAAE
jgi:ATP-dependent Clp protease ATP-binding subunit ClpC